MHGGFSAKMDSEDRTVRSLNAAEFSLEERVNFRSPSPSRRGRFRRVENQVSDNETVFKIPSEILEFHQSSLLGAS